MIKISVVTPSFNQGAFIQKTVQSVLDQSYDHCEHIVVDGGSADGTLDVLRQYPHLNWVSEPDNGKTPALNKGFRMASGEIIAWINSDDYYAKDTFKKVAAIFEKHPEVWGVIGKAQVVDEGGHFKFDQQEPQPQGFTHEGVIQFWKHGSLPQSSLFFRKSVLEKIGYLNEDIWSYMDYDFLLRLTRLSPLYRVGEVFSFIRSHAQSDTILNIASGAFYECLTRISQRYWGSPLSWRHWRYRLSYLLHLPKLYWHAYYERFAFEAKTEMSTLFARERFYSFLWNSRKFFFRYPWAFIFTGLKRAVVRGRQRV